MEMSATEPGVQFYSGNFLDGTVVGKNGRVYRQGDGLALRAAGLSRLAQPARFPERPASIPGQTYVNTMVLRFSIAAAE